MEEQIHALEKKIANLEEKRIELTSKKESLEKKINERQLIEKDKREEEIRFLVFQA